MAQWKTNPRVLVVHGGGGCESEDSYITIVAVPSLGCLDCKKLRDEFYADSLDGMCNRTGGVKSGLRTKKIAATEIAFLLAVNLYFFLFIQLLCVCVFFLQ